MRKIVIIGFGAAAYAALMTLKRIGCRDDITIVDPKECDLFHPCGLPYAVEGTADASKINQNIGFERMGVRKIRGSLRSIDMTRRSLDIVSAGGKVDIDYDALLLASGSVPVIPRIPGVEKYINKGIFTLSSAEDLHGIGKLIAANRKCAVIGAGAIGLEAAASLISRGCDVTVFEICDSIMAGVFDPDMSSMLEETLSQRGMKIMKSSQVVAFNGEEALKQIRVDDAGYDTELCIIAAGRSPSVEYLPYGIE
ncbi:MAG TPA: NAD(P)/FAD-dependent oxidoreductase, partial [Spirochaetota bacterium]|nr:NAD(P)/FAD-dependent oxidoreductase [Spirochaetota bacterium]